MTPILTNNFETKLGTIGTLIETNDNTTIRLLGNQQVVTKGYKIILQSFKLEDIWTPEIWRYETSKVWRWFIQKINNQAEQLTIYCKINNPTKDIKFSPDSGEHLDAIEIENATHHLHIGTEDGESMQYRAKLSDWMPERFDNRLGILNSFTEYIDFGFKTAVPNLVEGEKIYFHFVVATDVIRPSKDYTNERDISTWFAVDKTKRFLDDRLENTAGNKCLPK